MVNRGWLNWTGQQLVQRQPRSEEHDDKDDKSGPADEPAVQWRQLPPLNGEDDLLFPDIDPEDPYPSQQDHQTAQQRGQ